MRSRTNEEAIRRWAQFPREALDAMEPDGDFGRRHLLNPALLRMLGDVRGQRILDAGCGHGYLSRMLAARGARVTGVEPAQALYDYATEKEARDPAGISYVQADLCRLPGLGGPFDAVVANMVLLDIPDWAGAMKACADALAAGGLFVFSVIHPCLRQPSPPSSPRSPPPLAPEPRHMSTCRISLSSRPPGGSRSRPQPAPPLLP